MFNTTQITRARALVLGVVLVLGGGQAAASGIPVVDVAGLAQAVAQYTTLGEQLATLKQQYDTAIEQLNSLKEQAETMKGMYDDLSGISGHANMLANPVQALHSFIPAQLLDPAGMASGELAGIVAQLKSAQQKFTANALFPNANQVREREQYEAASNYAFSYKANAKAAYDKFAERRAQLESLNGAGATASTPGAKLDLIAKGNAEIVLLLNDMAQMMALQLSERADFAINSLNSQGALSNQATQPQR